MPKRSYGLSLRNFPDEIFTHLWLAYKECGFQHIGNTSWQRLGRVWHLSYKRMSERFQSLVPIWSEQLRNRMLILWVCVNRIAAYAWRIAVKTNFNFCACMRICHDTRIFMQAITYIQLLSSSCIYFSSKRAVLQYSRRVYLPSNKTISFKHLWTV